jgi:hypothetical protein
MKKTLLIFLLFFSVLWLKAEHLYTLKELAKPNLMLLKGHNLYVVDGFTIYIYSLKSGQFIKSFGRNGDGPGEFRISPVGPPMLVFTYDNKLFINSHTKLSIFTQSFEFIREFKIPAYSIFYPFKYGYISTCGSFNKKKELVLTVNISDMNMDKQYELYHSDIHMGNSVHFDFPLNSFNFSVYKDKIFIVAGKEGFVIHVFNFNGKSLYIIRKDYKPMVVNREYQKKTRQWCKLRFKEFYPFFQNRISFKTHYPAIQAMSIEDDKIFIFTYKKNRGNTECQILDLQGRLLKIKYLPFPETLGMEAAVFYIHDGAYYYLIENEDEEAWEIHRVKIFAS